MKYGLLTLLIGILAACSSNSAKPVASISGRPQEDDPSKGIVCVYKTPTGSFVQKKVCTTPAEREAERRYYESLDIQQSKGNAR
jgi:hypothetical protein